MIAGLENMGQAEGRDSQWKNQILQPVPHPNFPIDYIQGTQTTLDNAKNFAKKGPGMRWLLNCRLNNTAVLGVWGYVRAGIWGYFKGEDVDTKFQKWIKEGSKDCRE